MCISRDSSVQVQEKTANSKIRGLYKTHQTFDSAKSYVYSETLATCLQNQLSVESLDSL